MIVATARVMLHISWAQSLKDKRMVIKSAVARVRNRFNVSIAEVDAQDLHQTAVLGIVCVAGSTSQADSVMEHVICFLENRSDCEVVEARREYR